MNKICSGCLKEMSRFPNERHNHFLKRKYCTNECYHKHTYHRRNFKDLTGKEINGLTFISQSAVVKNSGNKTWLIRCYCGNLFTTRPQRIHNGQTKSCGCYRSKMMSEVQRAKIGALHPNWNPLLTDEDRVRDRPEEVKRWRKLVYERDNYQCVVCQAPGSGKNLNAHHLNGWKWCAEERYDVDNGATLCTDCHKTFHKEYGNRHNTRAQFQEFTRRGKE